MVHQQLIKILQDFPTISLEQLNATARFMERIDAKYLIPVTDLDQILKKLQNKYYILSIKGKHIFQYDNVYMDTPDHVFYHQHENKAPSRIKIRSRWYKDSNEAFFEFKQKDGKLIRKRRIPISIDQHGHMTDETHTFYAGLCTSLDMIHSKQSLQATIGTQYNRITLCSKNNDERITIDFNITLVNAHNPSQEKHLTARAILESKSTSEQCMSHQIMNELGHEKAQWCSKYCLWVYYFKKGKSRKTSRQTIKKIEKKKVKISHNIQKKLLKRLQKTKSISHLPVSVVIWK